MRKTGTHTGTLFAAAMMLLAVLFALPVTAAPAVAVGAPCHAMATSAHDGQGMAMAEHHRPCCDHHQGGQPCPDDMPCGAACLGQCAPALAFLSVSSVAAFTPRHTLPVMAQAQWLASHQSHLDAPPPRS